MVISTSVKTDFNAKNTTKINIIKIQKQFIIIKWSIYQDDKTMLNVYATNNKTSK